MLGTVGSELNYVNPELSWKTATKGSRTTIRRSRRGVGSWANNSLLLDARSSQKDEFSVSDSEKHGVAVLGHRFANHAEHVPLKKRELLLHSPSPPLPRNRSSLLKSKMIKTRNGKGASGQCLSEDSTYAVFSLKDVDNSFTDGKPPKFISSKVHVDFSGIALLAATACSIMINDNGHGKDDSASYLSSNAKHTDTVASMEILKESEASMEILKEYVTSSDVDAVSKFVNDPLPEQEPLDAQGIPSANLLKADNFCESEAVKQIDSAKYVKLHWDLNTEIEAWEKPSDVPFLNIQNDALSSLNGDNDSERLPKQEVSDTCEYPALPLMSLDHYPVVSKLCIADKPSNEILDMSSLNHIMQTSESYSLQDSQSQIHHFVSPDTCSDLQIDGKVTSVQGVDHLELCKVPNRFPEMLNKEACQMVTGDYSLNKSIIMSSSHESIEHHGGLCVLDTTGGGRQLVLVENDLSQDKAAVTPDYVQSNKSSDKPTINSTNGENSYMVINENMAEFQAGYESPFEDGELREDPILYVVEGNEVEGESGCVDNGADPEAEHNASNCRPPEVSSLNSQTIRKGGNSPESVVQDRIADEMKELMQSGSSNTKFSGRDQLPEVFEASHGRSGVTKVISSRHTFVHNSVDESHVDKASFVVEAGPKATGGKILFSHMEESSRPDVLHWKDAVFARPINLDKACVHKEREAGLDVRRVSSSLQDKDQKEDKCTDSPGNYWDSRNKNDLSCSHPQDADYSRLTESKSRGSNYTGQRQPITYSDSKPRRSPRKREGHCVEHRRMMSRRDDSRNRSRDNRPVTIGTRSTRDDIAGAASIELGCDNHPLVSARNMHSLPRRERGISPVPVRESDRYRPRRKSISRSRSRSPPVRHLQRERTMGAKRHSRSPVLKFETRIERKRLPFAKSSFTVDEVNNLFPSGRFSPKYHSKWTDNRNDDSGRNGRSPGRLSKRSHRFDLVDSPERKKYDDNSRRLVCPGRFNDVTDRRSKYDSCDDLRRKHSDKYEIIHRVRRYDTNGMIKRYRYDAESSKDHNIHDKSKYSDRRDKTKKSFREERGTSRYSSGRLCTSSPKFSRIRDYDEDVSPRKR